MLLKTIALIAPAVSVSCSVLKSSSGSFKAVSTAGAHVSAVFPPPKATNIGQAVDALFPSNVGFAGPTPTGDEAAELASATQAPMYADIYPLLTPSSPKGGPSSFNIMRHWGSLTPWYSIDSLGLPKANQLIPDGCDVVQVHLVHRHGARYPTSGSSTSSFADKLHKAVQEGTGFTASGDLAFLNNWTYKLGAELLTPFGRQQMFELGVTFRMKYGHLLKNFKDLPVFRTTSEDRMIKSAVNFATGFFGAPEYLTDYHQLITIEDDNINNTLAAWQNCPNAENQIYDFGEDQSDKWFDQYLQPTVQRLQKLIQGVNITTDDTYAMQSLCAYETVALGSSQFCGIFTKEEWEGYEYYSDVDFWYSEGPGNPATAAQGIGYVQEFLARLTQTPIALHNSSTNSTLDNNPLTFPLDQPIYVDATHDSMFPPILVAFNFTSFVAAGPLPLDSIPNDQTFIVSQIAPFGTNLVSQVLSCPSRVHGKSSGAPFPNDAAHIRFLLNDAVVPLTGVRGCATDVDGLCALPTFVDAMQQRIKEVDFTFDCFANYSTPSLPDTIVDGRPPWSIRPKSS